MKYVFSPEILQRVAQEAIAGAASLEQRIALIRTRLDALQPGCVALGPEEWVLNNAGGAMGHMLVLHASLHEYLIIFGTPIGTDGHTGRFLADDWFIIVEGEQWAFDEGSHRKQVYRPGDMHHLPRGVARGYRMPGHCYALEYARGSIPSMLPFGLADSLSSTLDLRTVARTMRVYTKAALGNMLAPYTRGRGPAKGTARASAPSETQPEPAADAVAQVL